MPDKFIVTKFSKYYKSVKTFLRKIIFMKNNLQLFLLMLPRNQVHPVSLVQALHFHKHCMPSVLHDLPVLTELQNSDLS